MFINAFALLLSLYRSMNTCRYLPRCQTGQKSKHLKKYARKSKRKNAPQNVPLEHESLSFPQTSKTRMSSFFCPNNIFIEPPFNTFKYTLDPSSFKFFPRPIQISSCHHTFAFIQYLYHSACAEMKTRLYNFI